MPTSNLPSPTQSSGLIQFSVYNLGGANFPSQTISTVGNATSVYDAGAEVFTCNFLPYSQTSIFTVEYFYTVQVSSATVFTNLYAFPALLTSPQSSSEVLNGVSATLSAGCCGTLEVGSIPFANAIDIHLCAFTSAGTQAGGSPFDYIIIKEFANTGSPFLEATVTTTSATPVTLLTLDPTNGNPGVPSSLWLLGTVTYFDSANLISNMQKDWMVMAEYNGTTTTVTTGPDFSLVGSPSLTYTVSGTDVVIDVIGIASETFTVKANYQQIAGGI